MWKVLYNKHHELSVLPEACECAVMVAHCVCGLWWLRGRPDAQISGWKVNSELSAWRNVNTRPVSSLTSSRASAWHNLFSDQYSIALIWNKSWVHRCCITSNPDFSHYSTSLSPVQRERNITSDNKEWQLGKRRFMWKPRSRPKMWLGGMICVRFYHLQMQAGHVYFVQCPKIWKWNVLS